MKLVAKYRGYQIKAFTQRDSVPDFKIGSLVVITPDGIEDHEADTERECKQFIDSKKGTPPNIKLYRNEKGLIENLCNDLLHDLQKIDGKGRITLLQIDTLKNIIEKMQ